MSTLQQLPSDFTAGIRVPEGSQSHGVRGRASLIRWLEHAIFLCLVLLVLAIPHPTRVVVWAFRAALVLWVIRLGLARDLKREPLYLPLLSFFVIAGISSLVSYDSLLSWTRLQWFSLMMLVFIVPAAVKTTWRLKFLVTLLLVSAWISVARTGWQYTAGIGTKLVYVRRYSSLATAGIWSGDMIQSINGHPARTPWQWKKALRFASTDPWLHLHVVRSYPLTHFEVTVPRGFLYKWLAEPTSSVARGTPLRAQGHFYNSVPYAGLLMLLAMVAWGVLLASPRDRWLTRVILGATFSSLVASLWATVTRAYLLALLVACFLLLCRSFRWRVRLIAAAVIILAIGVSSIWIRDKRRLGWLDEDDGYRTMMWKDSIGLIAKHPILGVGWDSVFTHGKAWGLEAYQRFPKRASHFHSTPIQISVDSGILGLAAWCWLMVVYLRLLTKLLTANFRGDWFSRGLTYGIFGSTIAFLLGSIVHYTLGDGEVMALMWLLMGAAVVLARSVAGAPEAKAAPVLAYDSYAAVRST